MIQLLQTDALPDVANHSYMCKYYSASWLTFCLIASCLRCAMFTTWRPVVPPPLQDWCRITGMSSVASHHGYHHRRTSMPSIITQSSDEAFQQSLVRTDVRMVAEYLRLWAHVCYYYYKFHVCYYYYKSHVCFNLYGCYVKNNAYRYTQIILSSSNKQ